MSENIPIGQAPTQGAALSLLSLSMAASNAMPIPVPSHTKSSSLSELSTSLGGMAVTTTTSIGSSVKTHRRLSSTGRRGRRLSDARDAASRPTIITPAVHTASVTLSSSASPPPPTSTVVSPHGTVEVKPIVIDGKTKRRGNEYRCESCSKVYRHPSCLIKHRWEHTPHWREASKFVLSKHQQVQLLEAAAILSHMTSDSTTGTSLPEDRSMWPSFLSGGSLPAASPPHDFASHLISSTASPALSIPVGMRSRSTSAGPHLHDYKLGVANTSITQLRPGLIGVRASPSPVISNPGLSSSHSHEDDEGESVAELEDEEEDDQLGWKHDDDSMSITFDDDHDPRKGTNVEWDGMVMDMDMD